jgi:thioesterase domain-containing protein
VPIFGVPGHNGDVFCYREFAHELGDEQPFYGLQPPGLDGTSTPLSRVEDIATYFREQIRSFHGSAPCIIAGFCGGGVVAFELARELVAASVNVNLLALIGAPSPAFFRAPGLRRKFLHMLERLDPHARELSTRSWAERRRYIVDMLKPAVPTTNDEGDEVLRCRAQVEQATLAAVRAYEPRRYAGRVCLILPSRYWARAGFGALDWRDMAEHTDSFFGPAGSDGDNMLRAPRVDAFAEIFRRACGDSPDNPPRPVDEDTTALSAALDQGQLAH